MIRDFRMNQPTKVLLYLFLMFSMITACSQNLPTKPVGSKLVPITLRVNLEQSPQLDPISYLLLTVTAKDMDPMQKTISIHNSAFEDSLTVPAGTTERVFMLEAKNSGGKTLYSGSDSANVEAGKTATINITLVPAVLMIKMTPRYQDAQQNEIVNLNIEVYHVDSLFGASFRIEFDSNQLEYLSTDFPGQQAIMGTPESVIFFDTSGTDYVAVSITRMYPDTMVSGSGALAQLRFRAISPGTTKLTFAPTTLRLVQKDGQRIPGFDSCVVDEAICVVTSDTLTFAATWNMSDEYSITNNPNGVWSYGRKWTPEGSEFDIMTVRWGDSGWYFGNVGHGGPSIQSGPILWAKDNSNGLPVVRWACSLSGFHNLTVTFTGYDSRGVDVAVYITVNDSIIFSDSIETYLDSTKFSLDYFRLNESDHIDFLIRWNGGIDHETSWTLVSAIISRFVEQ